VAKTSENLNVEEVSFQVKGTAVRSDLYTPAGEAEVWPVVVMAEGWCYVKAQLVDDTVTPLQTSIVL